MSTDVAALERALAALDDGLQLVTLWDAPSPGMPHTAAAIVAYSAVRLSGLRHWYDEPVLPEPFGGVLVMEASKWARLVLKSHAGIITATQASPVIDAGGQGAALGTIAARSVDDVADAWCDAAGIARRPRSDEPLTGQKRFDALNAWLEALRRRS